MPDPSSSLPEDRRWTIYQCPGCGIVTTGGKDWTGGPAPCPAVYHMKDDEWPMVEPVVVVPADFLDAQKRSREFTEEWYSTRFERLLDWAKENGHAEAVANIVANGTAEVTEPPRYAQILNVTRHERDALREALRFYAAGIVYRPGDGVPSPIETDRGKRARAALGDTTSGGDDAG